MMFLLRAAFWVSLVLVLLPTGSKKPAGDVPQIKAAEAASAATAVVADLTHFCSRQPESCAVGSQIAVALGHRAQAGAQTVYEFITDRHDASPAPQVATSERDRADATGSIAGKGKLPVLLPRPRPTSAQAQAQTPAQDASRDTLTAADRTPSWRAPKLRQEAQL
jgi:hypothetical protein